MSAGAFGQKSKLDVSNIVRKHHQPKENEESEIDLEVEVDGNGNRNESNKDELSVFQKMSLVQELD